MYFLVGLGWENRSLPIVPAVGRGHVRAVVPPLVNRLGLSLPLGPPNPPNRIWARTLARTSATRAHAPGRAMSVPSVLPPNRHRRARRSSASTAQHPGSCVIRVTMPIKLQVTWRPHSLTARSRTYLQR